MTAKLVILVSGKMRSGKNMLADLLMDSLRVHRPDLKVDYDYFAKPLKDQSKDVYRSLVEYLNGVSKEYSIPELYTQDENWYEEKNSITRILLQTYGTEIFRDKVDKDYWAKFLLNKLKTTENDIMIITDWRFKSESAVIVNDGSFPVVDVRVNRPSIIREVNVMNEHSSETELDDYQFGRYIENITLTGLVESAEALAKELLAEYF